MDFFWWVTSRHCITWGIRIPASSVDMNARWTRQASPITRGELFLRRPRHPHQHHRIRYDTIRYRADQRSTKHLLGDCIRPSDCDPTAAAAPAARHCCRRLMRSGRSKAKSRYSVSIIPTTPEQASIRPTCSRPSRGVQRSPCGLSI